MRHDLPLLEFQHERTRVIPLVGSSGLGLYAMPGFQSIEHLNRLLRLGIARSGADRHLQYQAAAIVGDHVTQMAQSGFLAVALFVESGLGIGLACVGASRRVQIAGIDQCPDEDWMKQAARRLTEADTGFLNGKKFLIHDRDSLFCKAFRGTLREAGVRCLRMPKQSPNLNAFSERFVQTVKNECTDKMIFLGEKHLRHVLSKFVEHYHQERPHQGLGNRRIVESGQDPPGQSRLLCRERLGGLLKTY